MTNKEIRETNDIINDTSIHMHEINRTIKEFEVFTVCGVISFILSFIFWTYRIMKK